MQHNEVVGKWLKHSVGYDFETIILGISWFVENTLAYNKKRNHSELEELYQGTIQLLEFIKKSKYLYSRI